MAYLNEFPHFESTTLNLDWLLQQYSTFNERIKEIQDHFDEVAEAMQQGIDTFEENVNNSLSQMTQDITDLQGDFDDFVSTVNQNFSDLTDDIREDVDNAIADIQGQITTITNNMVSYVSEHMDEWQAEATTIKYTISNDTLTCDKTRAEIANILTGGGSYRIILDTLNETCQLIPVTSEGGIYYAVKGQIAIYDTNNLLIGYHCYIIDMYNTTYIDYMEYISYKEIITNATSTSIDLSNNLGNASDVVIESIYKLVVTGGSGRRDYTNVTSDLTITVTTKARQSIVPEISGVETSYEYTGSSIKPEITVNIYGTTTTLTEGTDYTVNYGTNTELGTGSVYISSVSTSDYVFTDTSVNFNIVQKELTEDDVTVPTSITYTGSSLTPSVVVTSNGGTLVKDTDYTVTYSNQNGVANEYITVTIEGIGNYKTTTPITKTILITPKPSREIDSINDLTVSFGESKTYTDTADCEVTYSSSNEDIITVTHSKSGTTSTNKLNAAGVGTSVITVTYPETSTYAETTTTFTVTVNKASLTITGATISNKEYDGTTTANVSSVAFNDSNLTIGTDYTATATFADANVGTNKTVTVVVTLTGDAQDNYFLTSTTYNGTANITEVNITSDDITIDPSTYEYDGTAKEPTVTVEIDGTTLTKNTDYTVAYSNNTSVGTGKVTITGKGNYKTTTPPQNSQRGCWS